MHGYKAPSFTDPSATSEMHARSKFSDSSVDLRQFRVSDCAAQNILTTTFPWKKF